VSELGKAAGMVVKTSAAMAKSADGLIGAATGAVPQSAPAQGSKGRPRRRMSYQQNGELLIEEQNAAVDERLAELKADEEARREEFELGR
jgi:hypothetical protein